MQRVKKYPRVEGFQYLYRSPYFSSGSRSTLLGRRLSIFISSPQTCPRAPSAQSHHNTSSSSQYFSMEIVNVCCLSWILPILLPQISHIKLKSTPSQSWQGKAVWLNNFYVWILIFSKKIFIIIIVMLSSLKVILMCLFLMNFWCWRYNILVFSFCLAGWR